MPAAGFGRCRPDCQADPAVFHDQLRHLQTGQRALSATVLGSKLIFRCATSTLLENASQRDFGLPFVQAAQFDRAVALEVGRQAMRLGPIGGFGLRNRANGVFPGEFRRY